MTTYNEDYDKPLTTLEFDDMDKAIQHTKDILLKNHTVNEIEDITMDYDEDDEYIPQKEIVVFFGENIFTKDGQELEQAIKIIEDDDSILMKDILIENLNGA
jgi:hypothetical protein